MHAYKRYALVCAIITFLPVLSYWKLSFIDGDQQTNDWGPSLIQLSESPTPIWLDHARALQLIEEGGYPLDLNFSTSFDNQTGAVDYIVPNIVHYIRFKQARFTYVDYVCLRSVHLHHEPDYIFIHTDQQDINGSVFKGKYWRWIRQEPKLFSRIRLLPIQAPSEIFGQPLSEEWRLLHGSDIARARTMMKYGGIYLDNDVYVVHNLDKYRKFELALGWPLNEPMGTQVMIGHRNCRFLPLWLETYREYHADDWYYNAGGRPTKEVLEKQPSIVHRVEKNFGVTVLLHMLYEELDWTEWKQMDTVHVISNHRFYLDSNFEHYPVFNERNILHYPFAFGEMARRVYWNPNNSNNNSSELLNNSLFL